MAIKFIQTLLVFILVAAFCMPASLSALAPESAFQGQGLWKEAQGGKLVVRDRVRRRMDGLWEEYQRVLEKIQAGKIRVEDYPEELIRLHERFYALTLETFRNSAAKGGLSLGEAVKKDVAPYFYGSYVRAIVESFPGIGLNPLGWPYNSEYRTPDNMDAFVQYQIARHPVWRKKIWEPYTAIRKQVREGGLDLDAYPKAYNDIVNVVYALSLDEVDDMGIKFMSESRYTDYYRGHFANLFIKALPTLQLNPFRFRDMPQARMEDVSGNIRRMVRERFALTMGPRYRKLRAFETRVRKGELDPQDYPPAMVKLMQDIYGLEKTAFTDAGRLRLGRFLEKDVFPQFQGKVSLLLRHAFPDIPWTAIGMGEEFIPTVTGWSNPEELRRHIRYLIAGHWPKRPWWDRFRSVLAEAKENKIPLTDYPDNLPELLDELYTEFSMEPDALASWGIPKSLKQLLPVQYSTKEAFLKEVFPELPLHAVALRKDGNCDEEKDGIAYVQFRTALKRRPV